jgi:hypothetical protein
MAQYNIDISGIDYVSEFPSVDGLFVDMKFMIHSFNEWVATVRYLLNECDSHRFRQTKAKICYIMMEFLRKTMVIWKHIAQFRIQAEKKVMQLYTDGLDIPVIRDNVYRWMTDFNVFVNPGV